MLNFSHIAIAFFGPSIISCIANPIIRAFSRKTGDIQYGLLLGALSNPVTYTLHFATSSNNRFQAGLCSITSIASTYFIYKALETKQKEFIIPAMIFTSLQVGMCGWLAKTQ